jgi:uncharacterized protein (DUF1800 family)
MRPFRHLPIEDQAGGFDRDQATRLLWRAGFGPRRGEAEALAALGLRGGVRFLLEPPAYAAAGPEPTDSKGRPIAPQDASGHDHLWWLDRMVRGNQPLVERMTLVWHDWFATSNQGVGSQKLMLNQNQLFRANWVASFRDLLLAVTQDPAMLLWLNGNRNRVGKPNENYAREMMELFTLGADQGYTEQDVREQARALTGWRNDNSTATGPTNFRYDPAYHDDAAKTVFGKTGKFGWQDACQLALENPAHPPFFVRKLWSYFIPLSELNAPTQKALEQLYVSSDYKVRPVLESILLHPALYRGPRMMKPTIVYNAGLLRMSGRYVDAAEWTGYADSAGQRLFYPPNVAGWDDERWLDTQTFRARWVLALQAITKFTLDYNRPAKTPSNAADAIVDRALAYWDYPKLTRDTRAALKEFTVRALADGGSDPGNQERYAALAENALRQLVAVSPDFQTC